MDTLTCTIDSDSTYYFDQLTGLCSKEDESANIHIWGSDITYTITLATADDVFIPNDGLFDGDHDTNTFNKGTCIKYKGGSNVQLEGVPNMLFNL